MYQNAHTHPPRHFQFLLQMHKDDSLYPEAYEKVLESWMTFVQGESELPAGTLQPHAIQVFNAYVQCHLSPPDGTRNQVRINRSVKIINCT